MNMFRLEPGQNPLNNVVAQSRAAMEQAQARAQAVQEGIKASQAALKVLKPDIQARILRPDQHSKAGKILQRMEEAGYSHEQINDVVRALVAFRDDEMRAAFDLFAGADGVIDTEEMKTVVPLIGEDLQEEQVRCLFRMADKDDSGTIEFVEFCQMMYALTPKAKSGGLMDVTTELVQAQEELERCIGAVNEAPKSAAAVDELGLAYANLLKAECAMDAITATQNPEPMSPANAAKKVVEGVQKAGQSFESLKSLKPEVQMRVIRPEDHQRAGRIIQRMNNYEAKQFSRDDVNSVIMSLVAFDNAEMQAAYDLWAGEDGKIDASEFREVVPLLGEDLTQEEIDVMFTNADKDSSGEMDQVEFCGMMSAMQMKGDGMERYKLVGAARAKAYADSRS